MFSMLFSKPYFKSADQEALSALQFEYVNALVERSKNPNDFDAIIECLKKFERMHLSWKEIIQPYLDDEKKHNKSYFKIGNLQIDITSKSKSTAIEKSKKILFPKETIDFIQAITKDHRITKVGVDDKKEGPGLDYIIYFSDGSELKLKSLTDKSTLDNDKDLFTKKMEELQKPRLSGYNPH